MSDKQTPDGTPAHSSWALPPALADAIEPSLPGLDAEIIAAISVEVPEYARPLEGSFGRGVRRGVGEALSRFVAGIRDPRPGRGGGREVYVELGRGEVRQGRRLDSLLSAYRVGARVAWRRLSRAADEAGFPPAVVYALADAIFAYIDELSAESAEGFAAAQSERQDQARIARDRLLAALLRRDPPAEGELDLLAAEAGWSPPEEVVALACAGDDLAALNRALPAGVLSGDVEGLGCALLSPIRAAEASATLAGRAGADPGPPAVTFGLEAPWRLAGRSWEDARAVHELRLRAPAGLPAAGPLATEDALAATVLLDARPRLERLAARRLRPLGGETPASRARLLKTLRAVLAHQGRIGASAAALHVHPQTVRYRMGRLRELFGAELDDPDARFELELVLRGDVLRPGPGEPARPRAG